MITCEQAEQRLADAHGFLHIDSLEEELEKLNEVLAQPDFWNDPEKAGKTTKHVADIKDTLARFQKAKGLLESALTAQELMEEDESFQEEMEESLSELEQMIDTFEVESWFTGEYDGCDAILTVNPGSGGLEAQDWTEMLYRMYSRYAANKGWKCRVLDLVPGEGIGLDRASIQIEGKNAYGMLRSETGVHRLVRISPTDAKQRRHTTFAAVEVVPVLPEDDITIDIPASDVRVDVYRASGPGGQCVNTTDSAVRLTHIPTGIVVTCQNEKSQLQNKEAAFRVLRGKLYELEAQKREEKLMSIKGDKTDNSFGSQIRNYVLYPYRLIKDTRSNIESGNVDAALDGDIDEFVVGYHRWKASL
ncbi:MAG: peptide chain release factor 2 [Anaerotardibacter sp.]